MYYQLYSILSDFIYGVGAVLTDFQDLTLTIMATCGVLFVVCIPFIVTWKVIKMIVG